MDLPSLTSQPITGNSIFFPCRTCTALADRKPLSKQSFQADDDRHEAGENIKRSSRQNRCQPRMFLLSAFGIILKSSVHGTGAMRNWLERLGYNAEPAVLHSCGEDVRATHPYALELKTLLRPDGIIRAQAVSTWRACQPSCLSVRMIISFDSITNDIRKRIWNQNLATVVIEVSGGTAQALPARKLSDASDNSSLTMPD